MCGLLKPKQLVTVERISILGTRTFPLCLLGQLQNLNSCRNQQLQNTNDKKQDHVKHHAYEIWTICHWCLCVGPFFLVPYNGRKQPIKLARASQKWKGAHHHNHKVGKKKGLMSQTNAKLNTKNDEGAKLIEMLSNKNSLWLYLYYLQTMLYCQYPFAATHV